MRFFREMKKYWGFAVYAAKSDLRAEVANSYLNWLWWVLEPTSSMLIYSLVFGVVFNSNEKYFPVFVFSGTIMWDFFSRCMTSCVDLIRCNQHIISKVYLPKYILLIQRMLVLAFKMLIGLFLVSIMLIIFDVRVGINSIYLIFIFLDFFLFCFGVGLFLLHFGVYISDLSNLINIAMNLLFYITGIFYNVQKSFPEPFGYILQRINPIAYFIFCMRKVLLYNEVPSMVMLCVWLIISIVLIAIGLNLIYKNENNYVKVI